MNLLGVAIVAKGLNEMSKSGGGGYSDYTHILAPEEVLLIESRKTLLEIENKENISGTEVPAVTLKGADKLSVKKRKNQKLHSLQILKANPQGVKLDNVAIDLSEYSVVGTIDGSVFFALNKKTKDMVVIDISEYTDHGPHGDFSRKKNLLTEEPISDNTSKINVDFRVVNGEEIKYGINANLPQRRVYLYELDKHKDVACFYELATNIRQQAKEKQANESQIGLGE